ncbi:MAG: NAD(P)/FAD-dependent oxidoreductase [Firmicutes bacterium]|nr:NAD(P)/FAD-dependent oxidoreductase [Bacillota bacterium]
MIKTDIAIIGGGPAGLCAAIEAAKAGAKVLLLERDEFLGGQLVKQTHKFFGSKAQYASVRGIDIARILLDEIKQNKNVTVMENSVVLGIYEDGVITTQSRGKYIKIDAAAVIVATGASEKFMPFENNDLPGIYGAGAVQTLMNVYGIVPASKVVMVGAGNIGLIVSYQLMQAGVDVKAIMCTGPVIGGYLVHAAKVRRLGVPIWVSTTVKRANGTDKLESVTLIKLDAKRNILPGTEFDVECDNLCISVGLSPLCELFFMAECKMGYIAELGGYVPMRDKFLMTSRQNLFVAGDAAGVEEASSAMVEGRIAGLAAAGNLGYKAADFEERIGDLFGQLEDLRRGEVGEKIRKGLEKAEIA